MKNRDGKTFEDATPFSGSGLATQKVSRGAAFGDYDNDGDVDILVANLNDRVDLLKNDNKSENSWVEFKVVGTKGNRSGIGTRIKIRSEGMTQVSEVQSGGSFACQSDLRVHFGLGKAVKVDLVEIRWPDGSVETAKEIAAGRIWFAIEGGGIRHIEP